MNNSRLLDYLYRLMSTAQDLPTSIDELPSPLNEWVKKLTKDRGQSLESRVHNEIKQFHRNSFRYAMRIKGVSEEAQRAAANRRYYSVLNVARYRFGDGLHEGHECHKRFAAHMLRAAVEERSISFSTLLDWEEARWLLYHARIKADYDQLTRFSLAKHEEHIQTATMLFNALSNLRRDEESPAT